MTTPSRTGSNEADASGGNFSGSLTIPANTNVAVAFWSHWDGNAGSSASALSINGVAMTIVSQLAEGATTDESGVGVAILANPGTGALTHALTWSAGGARSEGGKVVWVYYQDGNTSDPYRAGATDSAIGSTVPSASIGSVDTTDRVVGFCQHYISTGTPTITGVTAFINNSSLNSELVDVGDATGLSGTVAVTDSTPNYSNAAIIALKEFVTGGGGGFFPGRIPLLGVGF